MRTGAVQFLHSPQAIIDTTCDMIQQCTKIANQCIVEAGAEEYSGLDEYCCELAGVVLDISSYELRDTPMMQTVTMEFLG